MKNNITDKNNNNALQLDLFAQEKPKFTIKQGEKIFYKEGGVFIVNEKQKRMRRVNIEDAFKVFFVNTGTYCNIYNNPMLKTQISPEEMIEVRNDGLTTWTNCIKKNSNI